MMMTMLYTSCRAFNNNLYLVNIYFIGSLEVGTYILILKYVNNMWGEIGYTSVYLIVVVVVSGLQAV